MLPIRFTGVARLGSRNLISPFGVHPDESIHAIQLNQYAAEIGNTEILRRSDCAQRSVYVLAMGTMRRKGEDIE
jgi:hypothetical protein